MTKKTGRQRVRLSKSTENQSVEAMHAGQRKAHKKAPRRENGKVIQGYKYKELLEGYRENNLEPTVLTGQSRSLQVPMFVQQPNLENRIVKLVRKGVPYTTVCRYVGITPKTFKDWLEKGKNGYTREHVRFYERVARAEAHAEMKILQSLRAHSKADWRVSAWQLERRWPEHWAKKDRVIAETHVSGNLVVDSKQELGKAVTHDDAARELARKLIDGTDFSYARLPAPERDEVDVEAAE
jgi:hypothetical protein